MPDGSLIALGGAVGAVTALVRAARPDAAANPTAIASGVAELEQELREFARGAPARVQARRQHLGDLKAAIPHIVPEAETPALRSALAMLIDTAADGCASGREALAKANAGLDASRRLPASPRRARLLRLFGRLARMFERELRDRQVFHEQLVILRERRVPGARGPVASSAREVRRQLEALRG